MSNKGSYVLKLSNGKKFRFRTKELFSNAQEAVYKERFATVGALAERIRSCPTGFEFAVVEKKDKKAKQTKNFNTIDFDD